jgi:hypothetical protein
MLEEKGFDRREEREDLPKDATSRERLKYIKDLVLFAKQMYGEMSYNNIHEMLDKIIKVSDV